MSEEGEYPMGDETKNIKVLESPRAYFSEVVQEALEKRRLETSPFATQYLVELLESYVVTERLTLNTTMSEMYLRAAQSEKHAKIELLKKLGDTSLYVSGFFGDSLRRKIVDIDYYADIGGLAYANLASETTEDIQSDVYKDFSRRFLNYVDLLTYISQNSLIQSNQDLLRLYERYVATGSELAREQLAEKGLLANPSLKKTSNQ
jgi:hypothetical protein